MIFVIIIIVIVVVIHIYEMIRNALGPMSGGDLSGIERGEISEWMEQLEIPKTRAD